MCVFMGIYVVVGMSLHAGLMLLKGFDNDIYIDVLVFDCHIYWLSSSFVLISQISKLLEFNPDC